MSNEALKNSINRFLRDYDFSTDKFSLFDYKRRVEACEHSDNNFVRIKSAIEIDEKKKFLQKTNKVLDVMDSLDASHLFNNDRKGFRQYNARLAEYFQMLFDETELERYTLLSKRVEDCNESLSFDFYQVQKVADLKKINLCGNRFCPNCQWLLQASRLMRFSSVIAETGKTSSLWHLVLTEPNCPGADLKMVSYVMFKCCSRFIRFLEGKDKIAGIDFNSLGYRAAFRSFEITYKDNSFHPHFHLLLALDPDYFIVKNIVNDYSYSIDYKTGQKVLTRKFSELEILIQKLWRLLFDNELERYKRQAMINEVEGEDYVDYGNRLDEYNRIKREEIRRTSKKNDLKGESFYDYFKASNENDVYPFKNVGNNSFVAPFEFLPKVRLRRIIKNDIERLKIGYSCNLELIQDNEYFELFKYICKVTDDTTHELMSYEQFKSLYFCLRNIKVVQGYGAWYGFEKKDDVDTSISFWYDAVVYILQEVEKPRDMLMSYDETKELIEKSGLRVISRKNVHKVMQILREVLSEMDDDVEL
ncbi:MAG: protein rep [Clostridiales bacterium]|jgi:plasmid rolling circle replication initiator protein Rep|nr:protein rep [Clostridiales bacterium]